MKWRLSACVAALVSWPVAALAHVPYGKQVLQPRPLSLPGKPLGEWVDSSLGSTATFARGCAHVAEAHLSSRPARNYATFIVTNTSGAATRFSWRARVVLEDGRERWLERWRGGREVRKGESEIIDYAFPSKEDFEGQSLLTLVLPLEQGGETCEMYFALQRRPGAPDESETLVEYNLWNAYAGGGVGFFHSGAPAGSAGTPGTLFIGGGLYPWVRHGLYLHAAVEVYANGSGQDFVRDEPEAQLERTAISLGYAYRRRLFGPLNLGYRVGPGLSVIQALRDDSGALATKVGLALTQSLHFDLSWLTDHSVVEDAPMGFGVAAYHVYTPTVELSGIDVSGHHIGALLLLNLGG